MENYETKAYLQELRYKCLEFSSVEQSRIVGRIFFNNIDSFKPGYQISKYFNNFRLNCI